MLDRQTIMLAAALGDAATRSACAATLAARLGSDSLLVFVEDPEVDALIPAPGLPQTFAGGPSWRAFLQRCRPPGLHLGSVAHSAAEGFVSALACTGSGAALVFVGGEVDAVAVEPIMLLLPLIGPLLRAEQTITAASGELAVARDDARMASTLAISLDVTRADLERQTKSVMEAQRRAEAATRAKDEFLAMLGHELRNPLAPIVTALQMLRLDGRGSREQDILERQVGHLLRLVDDLLDVSRIASGKVELRRERVEIAVVAARAVEIASPVFERKFQALEVVISAHGLAVDGDLDRLAQVFSNLLTNAAKYSDERSSITFRAERVRGSVVVRVEDRGDGIAPHMLESVFELFTQQRQPIDRAQGGLGLGLAIVKNLVSLHGGSVRVESEGRGKGSVFIVELPASTTTVGTRTPARLTQPGVRVARSTKRVLVVDDNEDAAELLSLALSAQGYALETAFDGPSALQVAKDFRPHVAILDIGLPVMDGYELARRLREQCEDALRLVALTGYGHLADKERASDAGFDAHLVKPVALARLQDLLDELTS